MFYTRVAKGLKLKVRKFWRLISTSVEVTGEKLVGWGSFYPPQWVLWVYSRCVKIVCIRRFSRLYFPAFGLNLEDTEFLAVFSPNARKYGPAKLWARTLFTQSPLIGAWSNKSDLRGTKLSIFYALLFWSKISKYFRVLR